MAQSQVIKKNEKAPFSGVIVTEETYRLMTLDIEKSDVVDDYGAFMESEKKREDHHIEYFAAGAAAGIALTFLIVSEARR